MESTDEHTNLRKSFTNHDTQTSSKQTPHTQTQTQTPHTQTPISNRKNSEALKEEVEHNIQSMLNKKNIIFGICGGQSSGKSSIALYLQKNISKTVIISEKDFFIGNQDRRKSQLDEKINVLNMVEDDYLVGRKNRLAEVNNIKNFDWDLLKFIMNDFKNGKKVMIPHWDKEKNVQ